METATVDQRGGDDTTAWWFLDALVVEHRVAAQMAGVVLEMTLPVGHSPALHVHETLETPGTPSRAGGAGGRRLDVSACVS